jgi:HK97 gp10 family phage protein
MVKIRGQAKHTARLKRMTGARMVDEVGKALFAAGSMIEIEAEISITRGSVSGKNHVPSRPGEPPNRDTGQLDNSIETNRVEPLKVEVSANAPYAAALEFGTSKMRERPFMRPAVKAKGDEAQRLVSRAVDRVITQSGGG